MLIPKPNEEKNWMGGQVTMESIFNSHKISRTYFIYLKQK